jgi:NAD(P)-dependent dehydrogenase (short-subunit alcohol dehydrogenase family)
MNAKPVSECAVVVLGGAAGVGLETAVHFAREGSRLALLGRSRDRGEAACERVREQVSGAQAEFVQVDATIPDSAIKSAETARTILGGVDVLVCATGPRHPPQLLGRIPIEVVASRLTEIVLPPLHMMHAVLPIMRAQGAGAIVTVASDAAKVATPGETIIGAAMAAILAFSRAAALEEKRSGIRINVLTPSLIANTPGAALIFSDPFSAKLFEKATALAGLGVPEANDLAAMVVYLSSPAARRITGQAISINGGISAA